MSGIIQGKIDLSEVNVASNKYHIAIDLDGVLKKKSSDGTVIDLEEVGGVIYTSVEKVFEMPILSGSFSAYGTSSFIDTLSYRNKHMSSADFSNYDNMLWKLEGGNFDGGETLFEGMTFSTIDDLVDEIKTVASGASVSNTVLTCYYRVNGNLPKVSFTGRNSTFWRLKGSKQYYSNSGIKTIVTTAPNGQELIAVPDFINYIQSYLPNYTPETMWIPNGKKLYVNENEVATDHEYIGMYNLGGESRSTIDLSQSTVSPLSTFNGECTATNFIQRVHIDRFGTGTASFTTDLRGFEGSVFVRKYEVNSSYFLMIRPAGIDTLMIDQLEIPSGYKMYAVLSHANSSTKLVKEITSQDLKTRVIEETLDFETGGNNKYIIGRMGSIYLEEFLDNSFVSSIHRKPHSETRKMKIHIMYGKDGVFSNISDSYVTFISGKYTKLGYLMVNKDNIN